MLLRAGVQLITGHFSMASNSFAVNTAQDCMGALLIGATVHMVRQKCYNAVVLLKQCAYGDGGCSG